VPFGPGRRRLGIDAIVPSMAVLEQRSAATRHILNFDQNCAKELAPARICQSFRRVPQAFDNLVREFDRT
jgi:hypothetical protein